MQDKGQGAGNGRGLPLSNQQQHPLPYQQQQQQQPQQRQNQNQCRTQQQSLYHPSAQLQHQRPRSKSIGGVENAVVPAWQGWSKPSSNQQRGLYRPHHYQQQQRVQNRTAITHQPRQQQQQQRPRGKSVGGVGDIGGISIPAVNSMVGGGIRSAAPAPASRQMSIPRNPYSRPSAAPSAPPPPANTVGDEYAHFDDELNSINLDFPGRARVGKAVTNGTSELRSRSAGFAAEQYSSRSRVGLADGRVSVPTVMYSASNNNGAAGYARGADGRPVRLDGSPAKSARPGSPKFQYGSQRFEPGQEGRDGDDTSTTHMIGQWKPSTATGSAPSGYADDGLLGMVSSG